MNEAVNRAIASKNLIESNPSILLIDSCLGTHLDRMGRYIYITVDKCGNISPDLWNPRALRYYTELGSPLTKLAGFECARILIMTVLVF